MVLVCHLRAEQHEDAVARRLHHVTVVTLSRVDHELERRIDNRARLFGVEISINSVEPVISANSAVTVLRSPSIFFRGGCFGYPESGDHRTSSRRPPEALRAPYHIGHRIWQQGRSRTRTKRRAFWMQRHSGYLWMNRGPGRQVADWISCSSRAFMGVREECHETDGKI